MSDIFNFKRFGKFLAYDLNNAKGSYGLSLLITGMMPVILFFFYELFSIIFGIGLNEVPIAFKVTFLVCSAFVILLVSPSKVYGHLTEKRKGADWLMIPASPFEKALTLIILLCVVIPLVFEVVFCGTDCLLAAFFPNTYGESLCSAISRRSGLFDVHIINTASTDIVANESFMGRYAGFCIVILSFALGAICFRKNKIGKTILCWFALSIVLSSLIVFIFGHNFSFTSDDFDRFLSGMDPEKVKFWYEFISTMVQILIIGGLVTAIYFRIKTIKH